MSPKINKRRQRQKVNIIPVTDPNGMGAHILRYLEWLEVKNYSPRTVNTRHQDLFQFNQWAETRNLYRAQDITKPILERYQRHLFYLRKSNGKPLGYSRQSGLIISVKQFFKWLSQQNYILYNPASELELPKQGRRLPKDVLSVEEVETILSQTDITSAQGIRDRALLEVLYSTGIRRSELSGLNVDDINYARKTIFISEGKGQRDRIVPIGERALQWIEKYILEVRAGLAVGQDDKALFLSLNSLRLSPGNVGKIVHEYIKQADINKSGACHLFRHTLATLMLDNGADIRFIQEMLGHVSLKTTQQYTHISIGKLSEIYNATHPAARLKKEPDRT